MQWGKVFMEVAKVITCSSKYVSNLLSRFLLIFAALILVTITTFKIIPVSGAGEDFAFIDPNGDPIGDPPVIQSASVSSPVNENGSVTLNGTFSDPDINESFTLVVQWGDGNSDVYHYPSGTTTFSETHQYLDDNPGGTSSDQHSVDLTLTDSNGLSDTETLIVTVNNIAPTLSNVGVTTSINENETATLSGDILDPGSLDTFTLEVNWGDGTTNTYQLPAGTTSFSRTHQYTDDDPSGTAADNYTISLSLSDDDTGADVDSTSLTVNNVAPALANISVSSSINENALATLSGNIVDPGSQDTFTLQVSWGDGATNTYQLPAGTTSFSRTHQYTDDDPSGTAADNYTISLSLNDDDTGADVDSTSLTVNNVAPALANISVSSSINENALATLSGNIVDPGSQDTFTLQVNWGDGATNTYQLPAGTTSFSRTHRYLDDNPSGTSSDGYSLSLTITDDDTGSGSGSASLTVNNVTPVVSAGQNLLVYIYDQVLFSGSFTDPGSLDTHTIEWDFGDGTPVVSGSLTPSHVYPTIGIYTVTLTVRDDDNGVGVDTLEVTVDRFLVQLPLLFR